MDANVPYEHEVLPSDEVTRQIATEEGLEERVDVASTPPADAPSLHIWFTEDGEICAKCDGPCRYRGAREG
jgi:hypothetical protein